MPVARRQAAPDAGRVSRSALHHVDVFDPDRAAVAEIDNENSQPDRRFGRRHGNTNIAKAWPIRLLRNTENATRLMLTASSISSIDIRMMMTFLRLRKMPKIPSVNRIAATVR